MRCKPRCPQGNIPGIMINALRKASIKSGLFLNSEEGRKQLKVVEIISENILNHGYCVHVDNIDLNNHPEQGPVWQWFKDNVESVQEKLGSNYNKEGAGTMRKIKKEDMDELRSIFEETGAFDYFNEIKKQIELQQND